ncbi:MAG TPA: hypothetical protein DCP54_06110 [Chryseobacterium sp.]|nr:hypothetical protein [Chryseobacterium sp.]
MFIIQMLVNFVLQFNSELNKKINSNQSFLWQPFFTEKKTWTMKNTHLLKIGIFTLSILALLFSIQSFEKSENVVTDTVYYYNSSDTTEGAFGNVSNWSPSGSSSCQSNGARPCHILVSEGTSLEEYIGGMSNSQVLAINPGERKP